MTEDSVQDGLNWYTYCNNNPGYYIDPSGNNAILADKAAELFLAIVDIVLAAEVAGGAANIALNAVSAYSDTRVGPKPGYTTKIPPAHSTSKQKTSSSSEKSSGTVNPVFSGSRSSPDPGKDPKKNKDSGNTPSDKDLSDSSSKIADKTGRTIKEVKNAIEKVKQSGNWRNGGNNRNPDVKVDINTGEVYPKTPSGGVGDSIGNIFDYLP